VDEQLRKRAVGAPAARSLLLTVLGEYVLPLEHGVWQETLVAALTSLDYSHQAARQAVARSARDGWLETERRGRKARMTLSRSTRRLLETGAKRIYSFGVPQSWDGRWLVVVLRVPEENRAVRHQLRSSLAWAGLGSLGGGVWLTPHIDREREITPVLEEEPLAGALSFISEFGAIGDPQRVISTAWDLDKVREQYDTFIGRFSRIRPRAPEDCFRELALLVHAWRKFPFLDPGLPKSLLPATWPRDRAHALFVDRHEKWAGAAQSFFEQLEVDVAPARRRAA
jgi:phenylacetic acid degradation operon negative regulatory protein